MLKKIFLGIIALFFVLFGSLILMMGYVFNNPEKVFTAFSSFTEKFMDSQAYEEKEEFFLQGVDTLNISSRRVNLHIRTYDGSTLKIVLHGKVPRFESGPFITQLQDKNSLHVELHEPLASQWIQWNVNGQEVTKESDSQLEADLYLPEGFKKSLQVENKNGKVDLQLAKKNLYEFDLKSVSGQIQNDFVQDTSGPVSGSEVGKIEVTTEKGAISVRPL